MKLYHSYLRRAVLPMALSVSFLSSFASAQTDKIAAGLAHSLAVKLDGTVWSWGTGGFDTLPGTATPTAISGLTGVTAIAAGHYHSLALKSDGTVRAWGWNYNGQLGDNSPNNSDVPVTVYNLSDVVGIAAGHEHSLAVKSDGTLWAWGEGFAGQLGDGLNLGSNVPVQVSQSTGMTNVVYAAAGRSHSLAVDASGSVWVWGYNGNGELGDGTTTSQSVPLQLSGLSNIVAVSAGDYHSLALESDGTLWVWGLNYVGQLGDGTTTDQLTPVELTGVPNVVSIATGDTHTVVVQSDGTVLAWGQNTSGQTGAAPSPYSASPVTVGVATDAVSVAAGPFHSMAVLNTGRVVAWGYNGYQALGDGTSTDSHVPVTASGLYGVQVPYDTDGDGLQDAFDPNPAVHEFLATWNADVVNPTTKSLFASYNFTPVVVSGALSTSRVNDVTGNARHGTTRFQSKVTFGALTVPNNGISGYGLDSANLYHFAIDTKSPILDYRNVKSLSFWFYLPVGSLSASQPIFSYIPRAATRSIPSAAMNPYAIRALLQPTGTGGAELVFKSWITEASSVRERFTLDRIPSQLEGKWVNMTFVWRGAGGGAAWATYLDGRLQTRTIGSLLQFGYDPSGQDVFAVGAEGFSGTGTNVTFTSTFDGKFDRVRLFTSELNGTDVNNIVRQDTDGDGIWDATEALFTGTDRAYTWNDPSTDFDGDGFTDLQEQTNGTDPRVP